MKKYLFSVLSLFLTFVMGCTSNPFGDDDISGSKNQVTGRIALEQNQPERVYVWLDEFNIGTYSENDGSFSLSIPPGLNSNVSGFFNLYFYVANYSLESVEVAVRNGEFIPNEGDLDKNGNLRGNIRLEQFLKIETNVSPSSVQEEFSGDLVIESTFQTTNTDTCTIVIPKSVGQFLGPVFVQNIETERLFVFNGLSVETNTIITVGRSPIRRSITLPFNTLGLPTGKYKVVPYLFVKHQQVPEALLNSISEELDVLGRNYLKLPIVMDKGVFEVN